MREYLAELRNQRKESQQDVANAIGVSRQYYAMIEDGIRQKRMDIMIATSLAEHFCIPLFDFIALEQAHDTG